MKRVLCGVSIVATFLALILYLCMPIINIDYYEFSNSNYYLIESYNAVDLFDEGCTTVIVTTLLFIVSLIAAIIACVMKSNTGAFTAAGIMVLGAICCFCTKIFFVQEYDFNDYSSMVKLAPYAFVSGGLLIVGAGLNFFSTLIKEKNIVRAQVQEQGQPQEQVQPQVEVQSQEQGQPQEQAQTQVQVQAQTQSQAYYADEKEKNLTRFLLTFFLGWIGSLIINYTPLKPRGYKSRTLAYIFLSWLTMGIYGLVASFCNLTFDPTKECNIGYYRDGTDSYTYAQPQAQTQNTQSQNTQSQNTQSQNAQPKQTQSAKAEPMDMDKQFDQLQKLKSLLDQGVITQEEFEIKKKQILGL